MLAPIARGTCPRDGAVVGGAPGGDRPRGGAGRAPRGRAQAGTGPAGCSPERARRTRSLHIGPAASRDPGAGPTRDLRREGDRVPSTLQGPGRPLPETLDEHHDGPEGVRAGVRERVGARRLREAARQVRGVPQSGIPCSDGSGHPGPPPGAPRRGCLPAPHGRDLLAHSGRLRQALLDGRRARVRRDVPDDRSAHRGRALPVGARRSRLVLLRGSGVSHRRAKVGLFPAHRDDVPPPPARHGVLRPAVPQSGHAPARGLRQSDRPTPPARAATGREHRLR